jgi:1-aminocyclopropane-1-carboxylate deaminase/D-cysteine desulfhydrase-like pyridoxal-dependent ACC family enzyme
MFTPVFNLPSPVQQIFSPLLEHKRIQLFIKRDDLIHPIISGNKWRKLQFNLQQAKAQPQHTLLTFGGVWSNHIHATAAAGKMFGLNTIGVIRGDAASPLSATLQDARDWGMRLHFVTRENYRRKHTAAFIDELHQRFGDFYVLPEGGCNREGVRGCAAMIDELTEHYDVVCVDVGTGTTLAGIITGLKERAHALGFAVLKGAEYLQSEIQTLLEEPARHYTRWQLNTDYHFGGYASTTPELLQFMKEFEHRHNIPLEPVYSAKMFFGIFDLIEKNYFKPGTRILAVHGGGLQGLRGFELTRNSN